MAKSAWIPFLAVAAMLAFNDLGCGGSGGGSTGHAGSTGSGGGGAAGTGTAGTGSAGTGSAGTGAAGTAGTGFAGTGVAGTAGTGTAGAGAAGAGAAGAGGAAGSSAAGSGGAGGAAGAGTAGTGVDGGASGTGGGQDGAAADAPLPACTTTSDNGPAMAPADFCTDYLANCKGVAGVTIPDAYNTQDKCVQAYTGATTAQKNCRSHHLCNAFGANTATRVTHCPHAVGEGGYCQ